MTDTKNMERRKRACALHKEGFNLIQIAKQIGVTSTTVHTWVDPAYAEKRRSDVRERRRQYSVGSGVFSHRVVSDKRKPNKPSRASFPTPHVDVTAAILGDPAPGRSALDRKLVKP